MLLRMRRRLHRDSQLRTQLRIFPQGCCGAEDFDPAHRFSGQSGADQGIFSAQAAGEIAATEAVKGIAVTIGDRQKTQSATAGAAFQGFKGGGIKALLWSGDKGRGLAGEFDTLGNVADFGVENPLRGIEIGGHRLLGNVDQAVGHQRRPDDPAQGNSRDQR